MMMNLTIEPQNRKSLCMLVTPEGITVQIPRHLDPSHDAVTQFIARGVSQLREYQPDTAGKPKSKEDIRRKIFQWASRLVLQRDFGQKMQNGTQINADDADFPLFYLRLS